MWQEAAFFRAVAHDDTFGSMQVFQTPPENLQRITTLSSSPSSERLRASLEYSPTTTVAQAPGTGGRRHFDRA